MPAGRKPTPTNLKVLKGNPGKRAVNKNEPQPPEIDGDLPAPAWLDRVAADRWTKLVPELKALGLLTIVDVDALEAYCKAYSRWREAEEAIDALRTTVVKTPSGYLQQLPQVSIARGYAQQMVRIAAEFGLTPASRSRLNAALTEPGDESKLGALLKRRGGAKQSAG
jgi:P27 family predicted phage terminase small subunit